MNRFFKVFVSIVIIVATAGYVYWQINKKNIVKDSIQNIVDKKSDSLYFIRYDSSLIDEVNGNVAFYNVSLQSDSAQKELLKKIDSLPNSIYNINVAEVSAKGIAMAGLLQNQHVIAKSILLKKPVIQITNTGVDKPKEVNYNDTLELYKKLLGRFKRIQADNITVEEGTIIVTDKKGKSLTTIENINISLNNLLIDSTRNYQNIISYFIKDVKVSVGNIQLPAAKNGTRINMTNVMYDAPQKILAVNSIVQYQSANTTPVTDLKNIKINKLNTEAFIRNQQLKAGEVSCDGGLITVYKKKKKKNGKTIVQLSSQFFDEAIIEGISLEKTKIIVLNADNLNEPPLLINDVKFKTLNTLSVADGSTLNNLISSAEWQLNVGEFSFLTKNKQSKFSAKDILLNNKIGIILAKQILLSPAITNAQFLKLSKFQRDKYDFVFNNIELKQVNFKELIDNNILEVETLVLQPILKIYNDRTLPYDTASKVGKFPHQAISNIAFPIYIKNIKINKGAVFYTEKSRQTNMSGTPAFTNINATINNVTNISEKIRTNDKLKLNASALFLGTTNLNTNWILSLNPADTSFSITGNIDKMNATTLNKITMPLGMVSVKSGIINKLDFNIKGSNYKGEGKVAFLYSDLKIEVLKLKENVLKKRGIVTLLANTLIKNNNPINGNTYIGQIDFNRDIYKSFFNLIWKSILSGVKNTVLRK